MAAVFDAAGVRAMYSSLALKRTFDDEVRRD
jgi:hypothetical protein